MRAKRVGHQRPQQSERGISDDARAGRGHQGDRSAARGQLAHARVLARPGDALGIAVRRAVPDVRGRRSPTRSVAQPAITAPRTPRDDCVAVLLWLPPGVGPDAETVIWLSAERYRTDRRRQAPLPDGSPCRGDGRNSPIDRRCVVDVAHRAALRRDHARDGRGARRLDGADGDPAFRVKGGATTTSCPGVGDDDSPASPERYTAIRRCS